MQARIHTHIRGNVVGYVAVFLALSGTAIALPGRNTVNSGDIINGQVKKADVGAAAVTTGKLAAGSVDSAKVANGSLTSGDIANQSLTGTDIAASSLGSVNIAPDSLFGTDIAESTLTQVPSAVLGGFGRGGTEQDTCNPSAAGFATCGGVDVTIPSGLGTSARALVIGRVTAFLNTGDFARGFCRLSSSVGVIPSSSGVVAVGGGSRETITVAGISPPMNAGDRSFTIECNEDDALAGDIDYFDASVIAVAITAN